MPFACNAPYSLLTQISVLRVAVNHILRNESFDGQLGPEDRFCTVTRLSLLRNCHLYSVLGLGSSASRVRTISMPTEFHHIVRPDLEHFLEVRTKLHENIFRTSILSLTLANGTCPESNSVKALSYVDDHTHDLIVTFVFESLADSSQLSVQPKIVNVDRSFVLELVRPFATVLVL